MPSFKDSLDADQIQAVSDYVAGAAGKVAAYSPVSAASSTTTCVTGTS